MSDLTPAKRKHIPDSKFALSGKRFPLTDKTHDRMAISGATRSEHAGNISASTEARIKSEARAKLHPTDRAHNTHMNKIVQSLSRHRKSS